MKTSSLFALIIAFAAAIVVISACGASGPAPISGGVPEPPNPTPAANWLYVNHNGTFYEYSLPLHAAAKPVRTLVEWPGAKLPPAIGVGPYGDVAVADPQTIRFFRPPIVSFDAKRASLKLTLTPAITEIGQFGADLVNMEYDPNNNVWLFNDLGAEISELRAPITRNSTASVTIEFGQPGSKTAGYTDLSQGRFDVSATLYVYASSSTRSRLFKIPFPYAKPPSSMGIDVDQADFVDSSQYLPTSKNPASVLLGQYVGLLKSPSPGSPPPPPVSVLGQFDEPLQPVKGLFPNNIVKATVGALAADAPRQLFYALDATDGELDAYVLPMTSHAQTVLQLPCLGGASGCDHQPEHLFLAP